MATLRSLALGVLAAGTALAACGGGDDAGSTPLDLPPAAAEGHDLFRDNGCGACHGNDGQGGVGPKLAGIAGTDVKLSDGTTVVADADYLFNSIRNPRGQRVDGYAVPMPENDLSDEQIERIVAYIQAIGGGPATAAATAGSGS